jgi:hypothetical protein
MTNPLTEEELARLEEACEAMSSSVAVVDQRRATIALANVAAVSFPRLLATIRALQERADKAEAGYGATENALHAYMKQPQRQRTQG